MLDPERLAVLARIDELERKGIFDQDVEEDPPGETILPGTVDYKQSKLSTKIKAKFAFSSARKYLNKITKDGTLRVKKIHGIEHLNNLTTGAVITCNHFSPLDSFAMQVAYEASTCHKKRKLFRVIREGNYTSFPGFYGMLMRNCNTLPLSSNMAAMKEFMDGVEYQLRKGNLVLVYPEQSLWWNYRKPKPLKRGAFTFAAKAGVPVIPIFIAQEDSSDIGPDGFPIQEMTIFVLDPIYPNTEQHPITASKDMMEANYAAWKKTYEDFYGVKLEYLCGDPDPKPKA